MDASHVIAAFGGPTKVAAEFGSSPGAVRNWKRDGIPAKFWLPMVEKARERGLKDVTVEGIMWIPAHRLEKRQNNRRPAEVA